MPHKYKLTIAYDGANYGGWQVQNNATSIQSLIQTALQTALRVPVDLTGAGRTDAGVHALGQVAHFVAEQVDQARLHAALGGLLPPDIRILTIEPVADEFHARYSAKGKIYRYHLQFTPNPFKRHHSMTVFHPVDREVLKRAAAYFIGTHDFSSFANQAHEGSAARDAVRTIDRIDLIDEPGGLCLEFEGNGFLYKMVRNIVGTLLDVCSGTFVPEDIPLILAAKDRRRAGKTAPAHGLFLVAVIY